MEFEEYEKMQNGFAKFENSTDVLKTKWMVTEKIHGANFSFHTDGSVVKMARRRAFLTENENFFNHQKSEFIKTYPEKMKNVFASVCQLLEEKNIVQVSVYGELFGGLYEVNGKNISEKQKPVQREVQYSPNIEWCAFDISYRSKEQPNVHEYVNTDDALKMFERFDIFHLKPLFVGKMNEALTYELGFDSTIPKILGLPALPKGTNKAEGVVVKPVKTTKAICRGDENRVIVKIKRAEFIERRVCEPTKCVTTKKPKEQSLLQKVIPYATQQRLVSAISKIGHPETKEIEVMIWEEFRTDLFADIKEFDENLQGQWTVAADDDKKKIIDVVEKKCFGLLKKMANTR